jgi:hypothetical protein
MLELLILCFESQASGTQWLPGCGRSVIHESQKLARSGVRPGGRTIQSTKEIPVSSLALSHAFWTLFEDNCSFGSQFVTETIAL